MQLWDELKEHIFLDFAQTRLEISYVLTSKLVVNCWERVHVGRPKAGGNCPSLLLLPVRNVHG